MSRIKIQPQKSALIGMTTAFILSLLLVGNTYAGADSDSQAKAPEQAKAPPTITEILAERNFVKGDVARRIRTASIDTWRYLDKHHIYIDGIGRDNNYLVEFRNQCREIRGSESLYYKTHSGALTKFDSIGVIDSIGGHASSLPHRHCSIKQIYRLERIEDEDKATPAAPGDSSASPSLSA